MKIRTSLQPLLEIEADEHDVAVLRHQGLLWTGTDAELAALEAAAGPGVPAAPAKPTPSAPAATAAASPDKQKEG